MSVPVLVRMLKVVVEVELYVLAVGHPEGRLAAPFLLGKACFSVGELYGIDGHIMELGSAGHSRTEILGKVFVML